MVRLSRQTDEHQDLWEAIHQNNVNQAKTDIKVDMIIDTIKKIEAKVDDVATNQQKLLDIISERYTTKVEFEERVGSLESDKKLVVSTVIKTILKVTIPVIIVITVILLIFAKKFGI